MKQANQTKTVWVMSFINLRNLNLKPGKPQPSSEQVNTVPATPHLTNLYPRPLPVWLHLV